ncbi:MAG: glycerol-3-phosphate acyltransferase [Actinomycetota bacterium]
MFERGVTTVALWSGPLVLLGYLLGSIPIALLWRRARLRRALDRDPAEQPDRAAVGREGETLVVFFEAAMAVLAAHIAWQVISGLAPGGGTPANPFDDVSPIAVFSAQALTAWQSVALWAGYAAVLGHIAPVWTRFRGGTGIPPVIGLTFVYLPTVFASGVFGFFAGLAITRNRRLAIVVAVPVALIFEWFAWVFDWNPGWGLRSGAEPTMWVLMTGLLLIARNAFDPQWDLPWLPPRPERND